MFQQEFNGYKKSEVDAFIKSMKNGYEARIMAEKFKVLDAEKKLLELTSKRQEIEFKEQNIMNVIEKQKKYQEEGSKKIYGLVIDKLELLIDELELKFPEYKRNGQYANIIHELSKTVKTSKASIEKSKEITQPVNSENDSMRMLLNKMQNYKKQETPKEEKKQKDVKPFSDTIPPQATYIPPIAIPTGESGFSFEEALNPTQDLEEIMKAFDFYSDK